MLIMATPVRDRVAEILYVDDSLDDQLLASEAIAATGRANDLRIADSAVDMWTTLRKRVEQGQPLPSVLVVDIRMPKVDGHALMSKLAEDPDLAEIPVVVLSTSSDPNDKAKAAFNGSYRYETKPHRFAELVEVWDRILDMAEV